MSAANANGLAARRPAAAATSPARAPRVAAAVAKRSKTAPGAANNRALQIKPVKKLADFAAMEVRPADADAWPVHPVAWLQREASPVLPESSGLGIARSHNLPAPDFLPDEVTPDPAPGHRAAPELKLRKLASRLPEADLTPAGWDPRVARFPGAARAGNGSAGEPSAAGTGIARAAGMNGNRSGERDHP
jgi:hypothetical protein